MKTFYFFLGLVFLLCINTANAQFVSLPQVYGAQIGQNIYMNLQGSAWSNVESIDLDIRYDTAVLECIAYNIPASSPLQGTPMYINNMPFWGRIRISSAGFLNISIPGSATLIVLSFGYKGGCSLIFFDTISCPIPGPFVNGSVNCVPGFDDVVVLQNQKIYPNPASEFIKITGDITNVVIVNTLGVIVAEFPILVNGEISVSNLSNGFYQACLFKNGALVSTQKFVVRR